MTGVQTCALPISSNNFVGEKKDFKNFRNLTKEAIDDPGANDMGVGGTLNGATNKEPLETLSDKKVLNNITIKKKKNVKV